MGGTLSVSEEFSTNGAKSIKSSPDNTDRCSVDCVYLISVNDIGKEIKMGFDIYSTSTCTILMFYRINSASGSAVLVSQIISPANIINHITLTLTEIVTNTYSVVFRATSDTQQPLYIDNVYVNTQ